MPKWKYQKPQKKSSYETYLRLVNDKQTRLLISDWSFEKNPYNDALFTCSVKEIDGEKTDKLWTVWDFDLKEALKKKLKSFNAYKDTAEITVTKHEQDMEEFFELGKK
ncbi:hypothetical protein KY345_05965 [Candidatus Woesearchaeota archaeon]|nr:hypothetical protein [Candidatus Woesearchaeota archaeon]